MSLTDSTPYNVQAPPGAPSKKTAVRRVTAGSITRRKGEQPFAVITAYDAPFARYAEEAGIDIILVGDSLGMVVLGYESTTSVTLDDMLHHTAAVRRGSSRAHIVTDLPFGTYQASDADAIRAAARVVQEGGATSVKIEGGVRAANRIKAITGAGIPVMGHIGVLPQTAGLGPGFKIRGNHDALLADAQAVQEAGAYAVVLEVVDHQIAAEITRTLRIPTIGIGSGAHCDGQVLVLHDVLGLYPDTPSFAKRYDDLHARAVEALSQYAQNVKDKLFPVE
ncbi:MAG: 3-methyl-2-oxobutanoate hydroxymethyltransferase [Candidatus Eremiobacteraeota bacterium]|nr:3-methyl-2-oxobutanoate hydroxymethyltransferase [Candidatus Eremiobacteraeota bacterium]